jgi:hypothetical protein
MSEVFAELSASLDQRALECTRAIGTPHVAHLTFRVAK